MTHYIGFTTRYYTRWEVSGPFKVYINATDWYEQMCYTYVHNLSMTLDQAMAKMDEQVGKDNYKIDVTLFGHRRTSFFLKTGKRGTDRPLHVFPYGKLYLVDYCNK